MGIDFETPETVSLVNRDIELDVAPARQAARFDSVAANGGWLDRPARLACADRYRVCFHVEFVAKVQAMIATRMCE